MRVTDPLGECAPVVGAMGKWGWRAGGGCLWRRSSPDSFCSCSSPPPVSATGPRRHRPWSHAPRPGDKAAPKPTDKDLRAAFVQADADKSGLVDVDEFVELYAKVEGATLRKRGTQSAPFPPFCRRVSLFSSCCAVWGGEVVMSMLLLGGGEEVVSVLLLLLLHRLCLPFLEPSFPPRSHAATIV